jgi:hypothetical protein
MARLGAPAIVLALCGCAGLSDRSYGLGDGDANYDALKAATEKCAADGGVVRPRQGFDGRYLSNYECVIGKAR